MTAFIPLFFPFEIRFSLFGLLNLLKTGRITLREQIQISEYNHKVICINFGTTKQSYLVQIISDL